MKSLPNPINNATFLTTAGKKVFQSIFWFVIKKWEKIVITFFLPPPHPTMFFAHFVLFGHFLAIVEFFISFPFPCTFLFCDKCDFYLSICVCTFNKKVHVSPSEKERKKCLPPNIVYRKKKELMVRKKSETKYWKSGFFSNLCIGGV